MSKKIYSPLIQDPLTKKYYRQELKLHEGLVLTGQQQFISDLTKQRDDYKIQRDTLIDDIAVLKANISRLERENECEKEWFYKYSCELEHIVKHERDTIKRLERELEIINKHEDGLVSTVKLKDKLLKESGEKIADLERENEQKTEVISLYKKAYEKTHKGWFRYRELTSHIRDMKFASPYSYNYIHLVNFIKELERD